MLAAVLLAIALAFDAVAVAISRGAIDRHARDGVELALLFGAFQAGMAALGWLAGDGLGPTIARWDHWVAFGLLSALGLRMIVAGVSPPSEPVGHTAKPATAGPRPAPNVDPSPSIDVGHTSKCSNGVAPLRRDVRLYLALALATSIDAAAAGLTLPLVGAPPAVSLVLIGVITAALSGIGYAIGGALGARLGGRLEIAGGAVLIGVGTRILVQHLSG